MNTVGIDDLELCFRESDHGRIAAGIANRFNRQSVIGERLASIAGYPAAYRDLFATLRGAGMLPEGPHRVLNDGAATLAKAYAQVTAGAARVSTDLRPLTTPAGRIANTALPPREFHVVMSAHAIGHTPDPYSSIREMARVLRPSGLLVVVTARGGMWDGIASRVWKYARLESCDVLRWMWECGVSPIGRVRLGAPYRISHWLSEAVLGRKEATGVGPLNSAPTLVTVPPK